MEKEEFITEIKRYSEIVGVDYSELLSPNRKTNIVLSRYVFWYYLRNIKKCNLSNIARLFGKTHSTIIKGLNNIKNMTEVNDKHIIPYLEMLEFFTSTTN